MEKNSNPDINTVIEEYTSNLKKVLEEYKEKQEVLLDSFNKLEQEFIKQTEQLRLISDQKTSEM